MNHLKSPSNVTNTPRVHITYEVETENGAVEKELPFVIGVLGDFSGEPIEPLKPFKQRKFIKINADNFNTVMARQHAGLNLKVKNCLVDDDSEMAVNLQFNSIEDFEPTKLVEQVPALNALKEIRNKLRDLLSKADCSHQLEQILETVLKDPKKIALLGSELGISNLKAIEDLIPSGGDV
jgi:type VI secretion system protein ImpB